MLLDWPESVTVPAGRLRVRWLSWRCEPLALAPLKSMPALGLKLALGVAVPARMPPVQVNKALAVMLPEPVSVPLLRVVAPLRVRAPLSVRVPPAIWVTPSWPPDDSVRVPLLTFSAPEKLVAPVTVSGPPAKVMAALLVRLAMV